MRRNGFAPMWILIIMIVLVIAGAASFGVFAGNFNMFGSQENESTASGDLDSCDQNVQTYCRLTPGADWAQAYPDCDRYADEIDEGGNTICGDDSRSEGETDDGVGEGGDEEGQDGCRAVEVDTVDWPYAQEICNRRTSGAPGFANNLYIEVVIYNPRSEEVDSVTARFHNPDENFQTDEFGPEVMAADGEWEIGTDTVGPTRNVGDWLPGYYVRTFAAPTGDDDTYAAWEDDVFVWVTEDDIPENAGEEICRTAEELKVCREAPWE